MFRRFYLFGATAGLLVCGLFFAAISSSADNGSPTAQSGVTVKITPWGPDQDTIDKMKKRLLASAAVRLYIRGTRVRILSFELLDSDIKGADKALPPERYRAEIFSYENNKAIEATGRFDSNDIKVSLLKQQPGFSQEEFDEAVAILRADPKYSAALENGDLTAYRPMPPIADGDAAPEQVERTVNVGLLPRDGSQPHEIVGVNMIRRMALQYPFRAPKTSVANALACGLPNAGQSTTARGTAGQFEVVVTNGSQELWRMVVIRPSASSGTRASGVELRNVDYKGKRVFGRAHAPILNVKYDNNACGPYRDWQYQEGMFTANGTDVASGVRQCTSEPLTILESPGGNPDSGNFRGVAFYVNPTTQELYIVSEMEAGWYRYISAWRFLANGTIQPRFGFGGVNNSCVCNGHNHHVYWRFDFDLRTATNNVVFGPGLRSGGFPIPLEMKAIRSLTADNRINIQNLATRETYMIVPNVKDGIADTYARGDLWVLQGKGASELDDGHNSTGSNTEADLDQFVNNESVQNADIVIWYAAHFFHIIDDNNPHIVGPDLIPVLW